MLQTNIEPRHVEIRKSGLPAPATMIWNHKWSAIGLLLLIAVISIAGARWLIGPEVVVYPVIRGNLVKTVVASGHVETPFRVNIGSQITGTVQDVLVSEGQSVKQGQALIALEPSELKAAVVAAQGAEAQAQARLRQLRDLSLPAAEETLKQAQATLSALQAEHHETANALRAKVAELYSGLEQDRSQLALYVKSILPQGRAALQSATAGFQVGRVDFLTLVDDQATLYNYETRYYRSLTSFAEKLAELDRTVGKEILP